MSYKILFLTIATNQASYNYRVRQFLPFWNEYGIQAKEVSLTGKTFWQKLKIGLSASSFDAVIIQKRTLHPLIIRIFVNRTIVFFDYDDALYCRPTFHTGSLKPKHPGSSNTVHRLKSMLTLVHGVFAGSQALVNYAQKYNDHVLFIPTAFSIPTNLYKQSSISKDGKTIIGWIGGTKNLVFLEPLSQVLTKDFLIKNNAQFWIMSGEEPKYLGIEYKYFSWSLQKESNFLSTIDIGIMPIEDDEWSKGKCAFKIIQYMAYSKPVVASAIGENTIAVIHGQTGYLVNSISEWKNAIELLTSNIHRRNQMGVNGFEHFKENYERSVIQGRIANIIIKKIRKQELYK